MTAPTPRPRAAVAIVGSGPAGCFVAQQLRRRWPESEITVFDRDPTPYGLLRYGVAPDHQGTKAVTRQFDKLFQAGGARFLGNIAVGEDISLGDLRAAFDVVVLATGLRGDRPLGIPGADLPQVHGSGRVTRLLNDHPDDCAPLELGSRVALVGNGNVAIDIVRLLTKTDDEFDGSDVHAETLAWLRAHPVEHIDVIGRSAIPAAKFDAVMIRELAKLSGVVFSLADPSTLRRDTDDPRVSAVRGLLERPAPSSVHTTVTFHFEATPTQVVGADRVEGLIVRRGGESVELPCDSVITAIGFVAHPDTDVDLDAVREFECPENSGRLGGRLYHAGWLHRNGRGALPQIRAAAVKLVDTILADTADLVSCAPGETALSGEIAQRAVDFEGWTRIDNAELAGAPAGRTRQKIRDRGEMLRIASPVHV